MVLTGRASTSENVIKYPTGKSRIETAGVIVFSTLMATVSIQVLIESIKTLGGGERRVEFDKTSIIALSIAIGM